MVLCHIFLWGCNGHTNSKHNFFWYSEIYNLIGTVKGVQSVLKVYIDNLAGGNYSPYSYDIIAATKQGVVYPSLDPMIFEVRYPDTDIYGRVVSY